MNQAGRIDSGEARRTDGGEAGLDGGVRCPPGATLSAGATDGNGRLHPA